MEMVRLKILSEVTRVHACGVVGGSITWPWAAARDFRTECLQWFETWLQKKVDMLTREQEQRVTNSLGDY
jgi:hypothetical protein